MRGLSTIYVIHKTRNKVVPLFREALVQILISRFEGYVCYYVTMSAISSYKLILPVNPQVWIEKKIRKNPGYGERSGIRGEIRVFLTENVL